VGRYRANITYGAGGENRPPDVYKTAKLLHNAGGFEFAPGDELVGEATPRFQQALAEFQIDNDLKIDGLVHPGGPTLHALGRDALGPADGRPPSLAAAEFEDRFAKPADRTESGKPIFGALSTASGQGTDTPAPEIAEASAGKTSTDGTALSPDSDKVTAARTPTHREAEREGTKRLEKYRDDLRRRIVAELSRVMEIDPRLTAGADRQTAAAIMGVYGYRFLDQRQKEKVNKGLEALLRTNTPLYVRLTTLRADLQVQYQWHNWAMTDAELTRSISRDRTVAKWISIYSDIDNIRTAADMRLAVMRGAPKLAARSMVGGLIGMAIMEAAGAVLRSEADRMESELNRRHEKGSVRQR
jgi:hypothetical protein